MMAYAKFAGLAAAAVFAIGVAATSASAVTVVTNGGTYNIGIGEETVFIGDVKDRSGGSGDVSGDVQLERIGFGPGAGYDPQERGSTRSAT